LLTVNAPNPTALNRIVFALKVEKGALKSARASTVKIRKYIVMKKDTLSKINRLYVIVREVSAKKNIVNALQLDKNVINHVDVSVVKIEYKVNYFFILFKSIYCFLFFLFFMYFSYLTFFYLFFYFFTIFIFLCWIVFYAYF
jgi:hypothetical protein